MKGDGLAGLVEEQIDRYAGLGYPGMAGMTAGRFRNTLSPLVEVAYESPAAAGEGGVGRYPAVLVVTDRLIPVDRRVETLRLTHADIPGIIDPNHGPEGLAAYHPSPGIAIPDAAAYLLVDIERGDDLRGIPPTEALPVIESRGRSPLTIDEGVSLAALHPESLEASHCFMLAGSTRGDRRVPALWIADRAPKLGWCWKGNRRTWLGVSSASLRLGPRPNDSQGEGTDTSPRTFPTRIGRRG